MDSEAPSSTSKSDSNKKLLTRIRERYQLMVEADHHNRQKAVEDLKFLHVLGEQWDARIRTQRGTRPCYEFNKTRIKVKRIVNEMRANRPAGKVRAVEDSDKDTADIYEGLCRNIWNVSDGDTVVDYAGEYQVGGGMGAWRVCTEYADEDSFVQDILVEAIKNPFCLYADPAAQDPLKRDADDWILTDKMSNAAYQAKYGSKPKSSFEASEFDNNDEWQDGEFTRICEYWYKEPYEKTIYLLDDGRTVAEDDPALVTTLGYDPRIQSTDGMPLRGSAKKGAANVSGVPQPLYAGVAPDASAQSDTTAEDGSAQLRARVPLAGQADATAMPRMQQPGLSNAPFGLQQATPRGMAMSPLSSEAPQRPKVVKSRISKCHRIMMCIASGDSILEGPTVQAGRNHRFIIVYGEWIVIDGKVTWFGLTRQAKDAQRSYNVSRTAVTEAIASAPSSKFWATSTQAAGNTDLWNRALSENLPYLLYTPDPKAPGPPSRMAGPDVPIAMIHELELADQELKDVMGVYDASLGERSNEKSGIAISRRAEQTQIVNYNYADNMGKGIRRTWEILIDLIPEIYDTERVVRILGRDGAEKYLKVNQAVMDPSLGQPVVLNDLSKGKYDVTVTIGPSFSTQRQEAAESYGQLAQGNPAIMAVAGDLIFKSMDLPYADEIADRMKSLLPPQIQQMLGQDKKMPPEVQQLMMQAQNAMQQVQQQGQMVQAAAAEATTMKIAAEKAISDLKVRQAEFEVAVQKALSGLVLKESNLALSEAQATAKGVEVNHVEDRQALAIEIQEAVAVIQQMGAQFMQDSVAAMAQIHGSQQPQVIVAAPPAKPRITRLVRKDGNLIPEYSDQVPLPNAMQ